MAAKVNLTKKYASNIAYPTIVLTVTAIVVYVLSIVLAVHGTISLALSIGLNTLMAYLLFTSMHEAGHLNISGNQKSLRWLDEMIGWLSGLSLFAPFYLFKIIHFKHHAHTNDAEKDPDHWLASKSLPALILHSFTVFPAYFYNAIKILVTEKKTPKKIRQELITGLGVLVGMLIVLALLIYFMPWQYPVLLWVLPAFIAQAFLAFAFDWLPHHPHELKAPYLNTRVIDVPALSLFLLSQNYHLIHHLHPRIPFYNYKNAYDDIEDKIIDKGVNIVKWQR